MSRRKSSGVLLYLQGIEGLLEQGDPAEIAAARQRYWKLKNKEYRAKRRVKTHEIKVCMTADQYACMKESATTYNRALSVFIKDISLAYLRGVYVTPDNAAVRRLEAFLIRGLTVIEKMASKESKNWFRSNDYDEMRKVVYDMKEQVNRELRNPKLLLEIISAHPERWSEIFEIITGHKNET